MKTQWQQLLSAQRQPFKNTTGNAERTSFQQDFDRIIFSSSFRRLKDKTQVFPLSHSDYVRTRLTHSLEACSVGRSLGTLAGKAIIERHNLQNVESSDFGAIVSAAALAHDIGNPPFGHAGEDAIRLFFKNNSSLLQTFSPAQQNDFLNFEGNAQGFRILTTLQGRQQRGLELTSAVLGAFMKYPRASFLKENLAGASAKKFGFFDSERLIFNEIAQDLNLKKRSENAYFRHPLAFLVEVADDICYLIVDLEDAARLNVVSYSTAEELLRAFLPQNEHLKKRLNALGDNQSRLEYLRAKAIGELVNCAVASFLDSENAILNGTLDENILRICPLNAAVLELQHFATQNIYNAKSALEIEIAGFQVIAHLLDLYHSAMEDPSLTREKMILSILPAQFLQNGKPHENPYQRLLSVVDFVSGMTDSYAVAQYRKLSGIGIFSN